MAQEDITRDVIVALGLKTNTLDSAALLEAMKSLKTATLGLGNTFDLLASNTTSSLKQLSHGFDTFQSKHIKKTTDLFGKLTQVSQSLTGNAQKVLTQSVRSVNNAIAPKAGKDVISTQSRSSAAAIPSSNPKSAQSSKKSASSNHNKPESSSNSFSDFIGKGEGDYNSVNLGKKGKYKSAKMNLTEMTVNDVLRLQKQRKINAAGKFQIIRDTMPAVVKGLNLTGKEKFNEETQEQMGAWLLFNKRKVLGDYLRGKNNNRKAAGDAASREWASLPVLSDILVTKSGKKVFKARRGNTAYSDGVNKALHKPEELEQALVAARDEYSEAIKAGLSEKEAELRAFRLYKSQPTNFKNDISLAAKSKDSSASKENTQIKTVKKPNIPPKKVKPAVASQQVSKPPASTDVLNGEKEKNKVKNIDKPAVPPKKLTTATESRQVDKSFSQIENKKINAQESSTRNQTTKPKASAKQTSIPPYLARQALSPVPIKMPTTTTEINNTASKLIQSAQTALKGTANTATLVSKDTKNLIKKMPKLGVNKANNRLAVYEAFITAGFSKNQALALTAEVGRENEYKMDTMFGTHKDLGNSKTNLGFFSWQGNRKKELIKYLSKKGQVDSKGQVKRDQKSLIAMAEFAKHEIETKPAYTKTKDQFLANKDIDLELAAKILGKNYIVWAYGQDMINKGTVSFDWREHDQRRRTNLHELIKQLENLSYNASDLDDNTLVNQAVAPPGVNSNVAQINNLSTQSRNPNKDQMSRAGLPNQANPVIINQSVNNNMTMNAVSNPMEAAKAVEKQQENSMAFMVRNARSILA